MSQLILRIARKEIRTALRDRRFLLITTLALGLLLSAAYTGYRAYARLNAEREAATQLAWQQWVNQGEKNAHNAAHYGTFAFKPKPVLSFLDFGLDSFAGVSVRLEAHAQNDFLFSTAQHSGSLLRFGELSVALVLQVLVPLLLIFTGFGAFTAEREGQTLPLMLAQGVSLRRIAWGKVLGIYGLVLLLVLPAALVSFLLAYLSGAELSGDLLRRSWLLLGAYLLYFWVFTGLIVWISARSRNSRNALLTLLAVWVAFTIFIPKLSANLGDYWYPLPSRISFDQTIERAVNEGIDGHNPADDRTAAFTRQVLDQYGVDSVAQLPINIDGLLMQADEDYRIRVYDYHFTRVQEIIRQQNRVSQYAGLLNPFLAIRNLSMGLAGTDYHQHLHFQVAAEAYRRPLVQQLNTYLTENSRSGDWESRADPRLWASVGEFRYRMPAAGWVLDNHRLALISLLAWTVLVTALISRKW
jgi:ABC-2 type transport system permease protein